MLIPDSFRIFLITGGAGFIGSHIVDELLAMGKKVTVLDNLTSGKYEFIKNHLKNPNFAFIKGDLLLEEDLDSVFERKFDTILHLAANPDISKGIKDPTIDFKQTIVATFNLLIRMKENNIKKMIFFSGSGVYGDVKDKYTPEDFGPLLPVSMYGASKLSAEALISAFSRLFDIKTWIFRPANIIGDRATHGVVFDFIKKLNKNPHKLTVLGDGNQSKSYLFISDVLDALWISLSKTDELINIFNIASKSFITVNEIADLIIQTLNLKNVEISHTEGNIGWPGDIPIVRIENKKISELGWSPKFNSYDAVKKTAEVISNNELI